MQKSYQRLITTSLLIISFIFLCGVDACETGYTISGTVEGDADSGVTITLSEDGTGSTTTSSGGSYTFTGLDNGTFTVTPSLSGYTFAPVSQSVTVSGGDETGVDFTATEDETGGDTGDERFTDNGDGTVTDTKTSLIWLKNTDCCSYQNWSSAMSSAAGLNDGECDLTDGSSEGEWRLPTKEELQGIGTDPPTAWDPGYPSVTWTMPGSPFVSVQSYYYWSSTEYNTSFAWIVDVSNGSAGGSYKDDNSYVWPVRSDN